MKALLVIDYTNDFIAPNGALTCGDPGRKSTTASRNLRTLFKERRLCHLPDGHSSKKRPIPSGNETVPAT